MEYPKHLQSKLDRAGITFGKYDDALDTIDKRLLSKILSKGFLDQEDPEVIYLKGLHEECMKFQGNRNLSNFANEFENSAMSS